MAETFSFVPQYSWEMTREYNVLVSNFESGLEQRRYKGAKPKSWKLQFIGTWAFISSISDFFDARKGSYEAFSWTPLNTSTAITVRFRESSLTISRKGLSNYAECEVVLQEVL